MNILAIDTSSKYLTISCGSQTAIGGMFSQEIGNQHSEKLTGEVELLLEKSGLKLSDIGLAGVVTGPGSFTGLRVGISFIKGLAMALGIKTIGLNALDALAIEHGNKKIKLVSPMIDARKGQVYAALYNVDQEAPALISDYEARSPADWLQGIPEGALLLGSGAETYRDLIRNDFKQHVLLDENIVTISPKVLYESVARAAMQNKALDPEDLDAFYLRQADAVCKPARH